MKLVRNLVEKPWGRIDLPVWAGGGGGARVGEIWFAAPEGAPEPPLLVKHIFTAERLSIQVHPDDAQARARGLPHGKSECWYIVDAEDGAALGLGLAEAVEPAALRAAALDGSIEALLDWKPVAAGDFFHVPAGTIHAIGGGISLIEVQQVSDVTYRLYDYGRPRELHLDDAVAVADPRPYPAELARKAAAGSAILVAGPHFTVLRVEGASDALSGRVRMAIPLAGEIAAGGDIAGPGDCLLVPAGAPIDAAPDAAFLLAAAGPPD
ncbi:MAG: class I mannose-6-phosphate isomerase [Allosphingosinicella sp.]